MAISFIKPRSRIGPQVLDQTEPGVDDIVLLTADAAIDETHEASADVTDHPVEGGENISDHVQPKPRTLRMTVSVSNTPLVESNQEANRVLKAHETLVRMLNSRQPVRVITGIEDYGNMALMRYSTTRNASTGQQLRAALEFKQVKIVQSSSVPIPASILKEPQKPSAKSEEDLGKQGEGSVDSATEDKGKTILGATFGGE